MSASQHSILARVDWQAGVCTHVGAQPKSCSQEINNCRYKLAGSKRARVLHWRAFHPWRQRPGVVAGGSKTWNRIEKAHVAEAVGWVRCGRPRRNRPLSTRQPTPFHASSGIATICRPNKGSRIMIHISVPTHSAQDGLASQPSQGAELFADSVAEVRLGMLLPLLPITRSRTCYSTDRSHRS